MPNKQQNKVITSEPNKSLRVEDFESFTLAERKELVNNIFSDMQTYVDRMFSGQKYVYILN